MILEFLTHLLSLDVAWIINLFFLNLHWVFLVALIMYFFLEGKHVLYGIIFFFIAAWGWTDFGNLTGWAIFVGGFLFLYYVTKFVFIVIAESSPTLSKKLFFVSLLQFVLLLIIFNVFMK